ncbi:MULTISPECIES: hypothetical protein [Micromonospora]|uniref:DUF305 domain-containing protein n=1 Tax=Micromonospora yangpuensis TaxID=683228 RepID=A0A1C6UCA9_9ACTN|nr:hypothetical protein [Micromonospora yangpuensis]GGM29807.1 hypothetical protein GCM10012279_55720 [Micromonospora yangpuensis]SCL51657.1 hypothetical protein GA0070617_1846 [Micromonospora yangpuensis]
MLQAGGLLILGAAVVPTAGCGLFGRGDDADPTPDPLEPLVATALDLAARHRAAATADPELAARLTPIAEAHQAHAAELTRLTGRSAPATPVTPPATASPDPGRDGDRSAVLAALRDAEQQGREAARQACVDAPAERAALLGSIAAARATHVEALK